MAFTKAVSPKDGFLSNETLLETLQQGLQGLEPDQKILVLIPDHTRTLPLPFLFRSLVDILQKSRRLDFMVALGTHPPLSEDALNKLVGISAEERSGKYREIGLFNHAWDDPSRLTTLGVMENDEIKALAGDAWHPSLPEKVDIRINKTVRDYDHLLIVGPVFPHEVAGFSGGAKYLFPGISGPEMINATHWLGALTGIIKTIGMKDTPVRRMIHAASRHLSMPVTLISLVMDGHKTAGVFIGDMHDSWSSAADASAQRNIIWCKQPYKHVLSCPPDMYDELWTAAKAMYKLEPVIAAGGEIIIYAPHLDSISISHGSNIRTIGYHILPFFLEHWDQYKHLPLGVLAHSTHLRGSGKMENGIEKPNIRVTLSSKIGPEECASLNLGYLDPLKVNIPGWKQNREKDRLLVLNAGEKLYRLQEDERL
jgi:lactate racemase